MDMDRRSFLAGFAATLAAAHVTVSPDTLAALAQPPPPVSSLLPRQLLGSLITTYHWDGHLGVLQGRLPPPSPQRLKTMTFDEFYEGATRYYVPGSSPRDYEYNFPNFVPPFPGGKLPAGLAELEPERWLGLLKHQAKDMAELHAVFDALKAYPDPAQAAREGLTELFGDNQEKYAAMLAQFEGWPLTGGDAKQQQLTAQFAAERDFLFTLAQQKLPAAEATQIRQCYRGTHARFMPWLEMESAMATKDTVQRLSKKIISEMRVNRMLEITQHGDEVVIDFKVDPRGNDTLDCGLRLAMEGHYNYLLKNGAISRESTRIDWKLPKGVQDHGYAHVMGMTIRSSDPVFQDLARELLKHQASQRVEENTTQLLREYPDQFTVKKLEAANGQARYQLDYRPPQGMKQIQRFTQTVTGLRALTNYLDELFTATSQSVPDKVPESQLPSEKASAESPKLLTYQPLIINMPSDSTLGSRLEEMAAVRRL